MSSLHFSALKVQIELKLKMKEGARSGARRGARCFSRTKNTGTSRIKHTLFHHLPGDAVLTHVLSVTQYQKTHIGPMFLPSFTAKKSSKQGCFEGTTQRRSPPFFSLLGMIRNDARITSCTPTKYLLLALHCMRFVGRDDFQDTAEYSR